MSKTSSSKTAANSGVGCLSWLYIFIQAPLVILKVIGISELTWLQTLMPSIGYTWLVAATFFAVVIGGLLYIFLNEFFGALVGVLVGLWSGLWVFIQSGTIVLNWLGLWRESWGYSVYLPSRIGVAGAAVALLITVIAIITAIVQLAIEKKNKG